MGKNKVKDEIPNPTSVTNRDILQRLNFLYQASVLLNGLAPPRAVPSDDGNMGTEEEVDPPLHPAKPQRKKRRRTVGFEELSRGYIETMKSVGRKTNVRMDPSVKRRICKRCSAPLVPGVSATVRIKESTSHGHLVSYRCNCCQAERRIPAPPVLLADPPTNADADEPPEASTSSTLSAATPTGSSTRSGRKRKKGGPQPRLPPHFARDAGHVVFRGNERLDATHSVPSP